MIKKIRQWLEIEWLFFCSFLVTNEQKKIVLNEVRARVAFKILHKRYHSMETWGVLDSLSEIHDLNGIPSDGNMILCFMDIINNLSRRKNIGRYGYYFAEMINWPELRMNPSFNRDVFTALADVLDRHPHRAIVNILQQRRNSLTRAMFGVPMNSAQAADMSYERNKIRMVIAQCEAIPVYERNDFG